MRNLAIPLLLAALLSGCTDEEPDGAGAAAGGAAACLADGGRWVATAPGSPVFGCVYATGDAGTSCSASTDCEGQCLARSGTCAPLTPLFGCHEVLTAGGVPTTLCTE